MEESDHRRCEEDGFLPCGVYIVEYGGRTIMVVGRNVCRIVVGGLMFRSWCIIDYAPVAIVIFGVSIYRYGYCFLYQYLLLLMIYCLVDFNAKVFIS